MSHLGEARMCKQCLGFVQIERNRLVTTCWDRFETHFHHCIHYHPFQSWCVVGFYFGNYGITWVWLISHDFSWLICRHTVPARARCFRRIARNAEVLGTARAHGVALDILLEEWRMTSFPEKDFFTYVNYGLQMLAVCIIWFNVFFDLSWCEEMCPAMFLQTSLSLMCSLCILGCQGPCYQQGRPAVYMIGCQAALIAAKTMKTTGEMKLCSLWGCPTLWCATFVSWHDRKLFAYRVWHVWLIWLVWTFSKYGSEKKNREVSKTGPHIALLIWWIHHCIWNCSVTHDIAPDAPGGISESDLFRAPPAVHDRAAF